MLGKDETIAQDVRAVGMSKQTFDRSRKEQLTMQF